jgi:uncharacterized protein
MLVRKTLSLSECKLKTVGSSGQFEGYASVFNVKDSQSDIILPGAFKDTLAKAGLPKMFWNHGWDMPIGKYVDAAEDSTGLYVKGELTPGHSLSSDVHAAMLHQTLDGLSVGGFVRKSGYSEADGVRYIKTWSELIEISPTAFPSNPDARINLASVKGADFLEAIDGCETVRDLEGLLRDAAGFSKGASAAFLARVKSLVDVRDAQDGDEVSKSIVQRLNALAA